MPAEHPRNNGGTRFAGAGPRLCPPQQRFPPSYQHTSFSVASASNMSNRSSEDANLSLSFDQDFDRRVRKRARKITKLIVKQTTVHPPVYRASTKAFTLAPRSYQNELFERSKSRNVIVCLDTGSGKTLVSVLLLLHVRDLELIRLGKPLPTDQVELPLPSSDDASDKVKVDYDSDSVLSELGTDFGEPLRIPFTLSQEQGPKRKVSFFLVNLVPLVHQQANVIAANSTLKVGKLYGELKDEIRSSKSSIDTWRSTEWNALMSAHEVIVSTAQCLLDALIHGYIHMGDINLLIFDEAHHAIKSHPYARIMVYYRITEKEDRPKIFGMTASPLFTAASDFQEASKQLQKTMFAELFTAPPENQTDLQNVVNRPVELVAQYDTPDEAFNHTSLSLEMAEKCREISDDFETTVWPKIKYSLANYGPLMTDLVWTGSTQGFRAKAGKWDESARAVRNEQSLLSTEWTGKAYQHMIGEEIKLSHLSWDADLNRAMLDILKDKPQPPATFEIGLDNCTPKMLRLVEILKCFGASQASKQALCGIVFVQRRQTAFSLAEFLKRVPGLEFVHAEWIVGHDTSNGPAMDWHDQVAVLHRFQRREPTNLLIATSVAEEGIDIQAANLVIRFDLFNRHIGFLQSKGRARSQNSRFIMMAEKGNLEHFSIITSAATMESGRSDWLERLAEKRVEETEAYLQPEEDELGETYFIEEETGARLYPQDAPQLISHYTAYLQTEDFPEPSPEFNIQVIHEFGSKRFICSLQLPANAKVREVISKPWQNKRSAKRMAAFEACRMLREMDALNEHLMPRMPFRPLLDTRTAQTSAVMLQKRQARICHLPIRDFDGWKTVPPVLMPGEQGTVELYATLVPFDRFSQQVHYRSMLLLIRQPLPPTAKTSLFFDDAFRDMGGIEPSFPLELRYDQIDMVKHFTMTLLNLVGRRDWKYDDQLSFLLLPLQTSSSEIDWAQVSHLYNNTTNPLNFDDLSDVMLSDSSRLATADCYIVEQVRWDLNPFSIPPPGSAEERKGCETYFAYYRDVIKYYNTSLIESPRADQPLLSVRKLKKFKNMLTLTGEKGKDARMIVIIPSFYRVCPISLSVARSGLLLPSLLYRYDELLLTSHCNSTLFSSRIDNDALLQALTSPSLKTPYNYERFEFYGDTFLKLVASCHTFTTRHYQTEGELHVANKEMIVNAKLFQDGMRLGLWRFLQCSNRWMMGRRFYPPVLGEETRENAIVGKTKVMVQDEVERKESEDDDDEPSHHIYLGNVTSQTKPSELDSVGEKTISDLIESILGASLTTSSMDQTIRISQVLGVLPPSINSMTDFATQFSSLGEKALSENWADRVDSSALHHLESKFSYKFRLAHLALEAFTHPSLLASVLPSYQRLEFLGDAFLDFYSVQYLMTAYPDMDQADLTAMKDNMVANATLAALSEVLELSEFVSSHSLPLKEAIAKHREAVRELRLKGGEEQYWWQIKAPKAAADVVESSFGAVLVDSGFDLAVGQKVFDALFLPFMEKYCRLEKAVIPNTKLLARLLFDRSRCTQWSLDITFLGSPQISKVEGIEKAVGVRCSIVYHSTIIAQIATRFRSAQQRETIRKASSSPIDYDLLISVIKSMRWARPFVASADYPSINQDKPPKLEILKRCDCQARRSTTSNGKEERETCP